MKNACPDQAPSGTKGALRLSPCRAGVRCELHPHRKQGGLLQRETPHVQKSRETVSHPACYPTAIRSDQSKELRPVPTPLGGFPFLKFGLCLLNSLDLAFGA